MFGYIRPVKNDCDNYLFKSQYCCLCKTLGNKYGQFSRLFLSYDISLLALFLHAFSGKKFDYNYESCIMHPIHKRRVKKGTDIDQIAADISVYFAQKKIEDNIKDERLIKKSFFKMLRVVPMNWNRTIPFKNDDLHNHFLHLEKMEQRKNPEIDDISNCFGKILEQTVHYASDKLTIKVPEKFEQLVFLMGKLIYTLDAFEDLDKDLKDWNYNPLIYGNKDLVLSIGKTEEALKEIQQKEKWRLYLLLDHIIYDYSFIREFLGVYRIEIDGIISKSLPAMVYRVVGEKSICQNKGEFHE